MVFYFIYFLAAFCGMWGMWDLSYPTRGRNQTGAHCIGSTESYPRVCKGSPTECVFYSNHSPCSFIQVVLSKCLTAFAINSALQGIKFLLFNLLTNKARTTINHIDSRIRWNGWNPLNFSQGWRSVLVSTRWRPALWYSNYASMPKVEKLFVLFLFSFLWISVFVSLSKWISLINHIVSTKPLHFDRYILRTNKQNKP